MTCKNHKSKKNHRLTKKYHKKGTSLFPTSILKGKNGKKIPKETTDFIPKETTDFIQTYSHLLKEKVKNKELEKIKTL